SGKAPEALVARRDDPHRSLSAWRPVGSAAPRARPVVGGLEPRLASSHERRRQHGHRRRARRTASAACRRRAGRLARPQRELLCAPATPAWTTPGRCGRSAARPPPQHFCGCRPNGDREALVVEETTSAVREGVQVDVNRIAMKSEYPLAVLRKFLK